MAGQLLEKLVVAARQITWSGSAARHQLRWTAKPFFRESRKAGRRPPKTPKKPLPLPRELAPDPWESTKCTRNPRAFGSQLKNMTFFDRRRSAWQPPDRDGAGRRAN
jgi:hypothetical protein